MQIFTLTQQWTGDSTRKYYADSVTSSLYCQTLTKSSFLRFTQRLTLSSYDHKQISPTHTKNLRRVISNTKLDQLQRNSVNLYSTITLYTSPFGLLVEVRVWHWRSLLLLSHNIYEYQTLTRYKLFNYHIYNHRNLKRKTIITFSVNLKSTWPHSCLGFNDNWFEAVCVLWHSVSESEHWDITTGWELLHRMGVTAWWMGQLLNPEWFRPIIEVFRKKMKVIGSISVVIMRFWALILWMAKPPFNWWVKIVILPKIDILFVK